MNFLIDLIIIAIFVGFCVLGYKLGIIKMLVRFFKNIVALVVAGLFASKLGAYLNEVFFGKLFKDMTVERIAGWLGVDAETIPDIGPLIEAGHTEFFDFVQKLGFDTEAIVDKYSQFGDNSEELMVEYIASPLAAAVSTVVAFLLLFVATVLVVQLVGFIIGRIAKLPVLNVTNRILGLILGAVLGVIFVLLFTAIVNAVTPLIKLNGDALSMGALGEGTIIYKFLLSGKPGELIETILERIGAR